MSFSKHANMILNQLRELEVLLARFDHDTIYEIYTTERFGGRLIFQGLDLDIAESVYTKSIEQGIECILYNRKVQAQIEVRKV